MGVVYNTVNMRVAGGATGAALAGIMVGSHKGSTMGSQEVWTNQPTHSSLKFMAGVQGRWEEFNVIGEGEDMDLNPAELLKYYSEFGPNTEDLKLQNSASEIEKMVKTEFTEEEILLKLMT